MNKTTERITAAEWYECYRREAYILLDMLYGIDEPTEKEICLYILYGKKAFENRRKER